MFDARPATADILIERDIAPPHGNFRTPVDPEAGWAALHPDRAMLFLFVTPRDCGALDELMAL